MKGDIGVFWNMVDYPISEDVDGSEVYPRLGYSLSRQRYSGDVKIRAYAKKCPRNCEHAGIIFVEGYFRLCL